MLNARTILLLCNSDNGTRVQSGLTEQRVDGRAFVPFVLIHGARAEGVQGRNFGTEYDFSIDAKPMMLYHTFGAITKF